MKIFKYIGLAAMVATFTVSCDDDDDAPTGPTVTTNFEGTFSQEDQMGRPGINTVLTSSAQKNAFNTTIPTQQIGTFQPIFQNTVEGLYDAYSMTAGVNLEYENNILGISLPVLTTVLALDVLQVSPDADTSYFNPTTGVPLTGRTLNDDVIDVSLILLFGGNNGDRFTSPTNLVSDNVGVEAGATSNSFPYLTAARF